MKKQIKNFLALFITISLITSCNSQTTKKTNIKPKKSISEAISIISNATIKETITYYYKLKKEQPNNYNFSDKNELNNLGYKYLNKEEIKNAIEIFKLLVSEFPNSENAYDSLGEAYYKDGNMPLALKNYQKSLQLNPKNSNAEEWIVSISYKIRERPKFNQIFTKQQYLEDMDEMAQRITKKHNNPFEFITEDAFNELVETQKSKIKDGMTYKEFIWELSPIIASIACEHSHLNYFNQEDDMLPIEFRFPIEAEIVNDRLLVTNAHVNENKVVKGNTITSINGKSISEITKSIFKHISANGHTPPRKNTTFSAYITSYIPYYFKFPTTYTITLENSQQPIPLVQLKEFEYTPINNKSSFEIIEEKYYAKFRIPYFGAFGGKKLTEFKTFLEASFKELKEKKVINLIIDLRRNGGGCSCGAIPLLQYIAKKPFTYFDKNSPLPGDLSEGGEQLPMKNHFIGTTYVLVDGFVGSTGGHLASVIKTNAIATLIGEETGSSYYANGGMQQHLGTNTAVMYYISTGETNFTMATSLPRNRGVLPDHYVYKTSKDILDNKDVQMEYVLKLIEE
ncbi:MAG: S41 family peptidase [Cellulophaga sp.]